jgi:hypothetical protein
MYTDLIVLDTFLTIYLFFGFVCLLDPDSDPHSKYRSSSGSRRQSNADPVSDPKHWSKVTYQDTVRACVETLRELVSF